MKLGNSGSLDRIDSPTGRLLGYETRVLSRGEICCAPKGRLRRRIAALDSRPAFQGRYLGARREAAPRQRRLNLPLRRGLLSHPSLRAALCGWVAEAGLERPAYPQTPLPG